MRRYAIADVFTDEPLEGNPVAVFLDGEGLSGGLMQRAARELNLSETVFVLPSTSGDGADAKLRIFTPGAELPFAGHPVLGTAFVLGEQLGRPEVRLETGLGVVPVRLRRDGETIVHGEMDQPIPVAERFPQEHELLAAVGVERSVLPVAAYRNGPLHVYIALEGGDEVASLAPDLRALGTGFGQIGVSCFARSDRDGRFKTRMFAPAVGVPEDPATGSAAGPLALHLVSHGWAEYGQEIEIRQGAEIGRPSLILARVEGADGTVKRVVVGGAAVIVARGEYRLD